MTSLSTTYTPLETLLLFQALRAEGFGSLSVFSRISEQLKCIPLVHEDPSYDSGRLSPDALRELFLRLLKDEARSDLEQRAAAHDAPSTNGDGSPGSRKRKIASPILPTVQEASQHKHLIPQLVTRLYARYRENAVREIREHERHYEALVRDSEADKAVPSDDVTQKQALASSNSLRPQPTSITPSAEKSNGSEVSAPPNGIPSMATPSSDPNAISVIDHAAHSTPSMQNGNLARPAAGNDGRPMNSNAAAHPPPTVILPTRQSGPDQLATPLNNQPQQAPVAILAQGSPYPPHWPHSLSHAVSGAQIHQSASRQQLSPRPALHPSPALGQPQPGSHHVGPPNQRQSQHTPTPQFAHTQFLSGRTPPPARLPPGYGPPSGQLIGSVGIPPHLRPAPGPPLTPHAPHPSNVNLKHPKHADQPSPFPFDAQQSSRPSHIPFVAGQAHVSPSQPSPSPVHRPPHSQHYPPSAPATINRPSMPSNPVMTHILQALATPPRQAKATTWKSERRPSNLSTGTPLVRPGVEPLSPTLTRAELPARPVTSGQAREPERSEPNVEAEPAPKPTRPRGRPKRERSPHSVMSSVPDEPSRVTRSQSVSTTTGPPPSMDDRPGSRADVKLEPSTPAATFDEPEAPREPSATPVGARVTRGRRGTVSSQQAVSTLTRRQSHHPATNAASPEPSDIGTPPPRSNTITAYRNFPKLSATIMNDINSHKHASYFVHMVRERDAPGYREIIKQPQQLKSIRAAIMAGSRAVAAAVAESPAAAPAATTSTSESLGLSASTSSTIELERSSDVTPPRAIVNGAQLEKEVLRMLANAVLFNPGNDGMVRDTREMFEDVEVLMRHWRGAESAAGGTGTGAESATGSNAAGRIGTDEAEEGGKARRRKGN